jgi:hypothetical protein
LVTAKRATISLHTRSWLGGTGGASFAFRRTISASSTNASQAGVEVDPDDIACSQARPPPVAL